MMSPILPSRRAIGARIGIHSDEDARQFADRMMDIGRDVHDLADLKRVAPALRELFSLLAARRTAWTPARRAKSRRLARHGASAKEIAALVGATPAAVMQQINTNGRAGRKLGNHEAYCHACEIGGTLAEIRQHYREEHGAEGEI